MSNIRQVQWSTEIPERLEPGMLVRTSKGVKLVGSDVSHARLLWSVADAWAWLIQPHELNWLEDMANRKTRTQE